MPWPAPGASGSSARAAPRSGRRPVVRRARGAVRARARLVEHLPGNRAAALSGAFRLGAPPQPRPLCGLRRRARPPHRGGGGDAASAVVDDAHLLDDASAEAIPFIARRLRIDGIALVIATESDYDFGDARSFGSVGSTRRTRCPTRDVVRRRASADGGRAPRRERRWQSARAARNRLRPDARAAPRGRTSRRAAAALRGVGLPAPPRRCLPKRARRCCSHRWRAMANASLLLGHVTRSGST